MILITGHKGFIGSHLTKFLDEIGMKWIGYDLKDGQDINNKLQLETVFDTHPITAIIHLAALAGARRGDLYPTEYFNTNVKGSENVIFFGRCYDVKKIIAFSSSSAIRAENIYGMSKRAMEHILNKHLLEQTYVVRPFNVYSIKNGRPDQVVHKWLARCKEGLPIDYHGNLVRHYTHVQDILEGIYLLLKYDGPSATFDFGNEKGVGLESVLNIFQDRFNPSYTFNLMSDVPVVPDLANNRLIGWKAEIDFIETIKDFINE